MNSDERNVGASLAYAALDDVPTPKEEGVSMAKSGEIQGVGIAHRKDTEYLKSLPDGTEANNLGNLPSVSEE